MFKTTKNIRKRNQEKLKGNGVAGRTKQKKNLQTCVQLEEYSTTQTLPKGTHKKTIKKSHDLKKKITSSEWWECGETRRQGSKKKGKKLKKNQWGSLQKILRKTGTIKQIGERKDEQGCRHKSNSTVRSSHKEKEKQTRNKKARRKKK